MLGSPTFERRYDICLLSCQAPPARPLSRESHTVAPWVFTIYQDRPTTTPQHPPQLHLTTTHLSSLYLKMNFFLGKRKEEYSSGHPWNSLPLPFLCPGLLLCDYSEFSLTWAHCLLFSKTQRQAHTSVTRAGLPNATTLLCTCRVLK